MGTKKKLTPKRNAASAKMTLEDLHQLLLGSGRREDLAANYGSVEAARARLDMLQATNQWHRRPGDLMPFAWWVTEVDVPPELCEDVDLFVNLSGDRDQPCPDNALEALDTLEVAQWRFMAETGRVTDEDRREIARDAQHPGREERFRLIAEIVGPPDERAEDSHAE